MFDIKYPKIMSFKDEYSFLSNFYKSDIVYDNVSYPTVEHFYQCNKMLNSKDFDILLNERNPGKVKRIARHKPMKNNWDDIKKSVMNIGVLNKFIQNIDIQNKLIDTYPSFLIECNTWHDNYWGHCTCKKCASQCHYNILGNILMEVRKGFIKTKN